MESGEEGENSEVESTSSSSFKKGGSVRSFPKLVTGVSVCNVPGWAVLGGLELGTPEMLKGGDSSFKCSMVETQETEVGEMPMDDAVDTEVDSALGTEVSVS